MSSAIQIYKKNPSPAEQRTSLINSSDGAGLHFDGSAGNIDIASPPDLGTKFSFEFVLKADAFGTFQQNFVDFGTGGRFVIASNSSLSWNLGIYDQTSWKSFGVKVLDDLKVHHLVVTVDGTSAVLYDNGNQVATVTISSGHAIDSCTDAKIGSQYNGSRDFVEGTYYRARFYNKALTSAEVQTAYERADVDFSSQYGSQTSKILNGTSWTGASGTTPPTSWTVGTVGTFTIDSSSGSGSEPALKITRNGDNPYIYQTFSAVVGKQYRVKYRAKNVDATLVRVGIGSSAIGTQYNATDTTATSWQDFEQTYTATTTTFSVYVQLLTTTGTQSGYIDSLTVEQVGCVSDYQTQWANPTQSLTVQDASGNADGTCSASGVTQVQPVVQLNSTSARIGTSAATPADGDIIADKVGAGIAPAAPFHAKTAATTGYFPLEVARLEVKDEGLNMNAGMGPKLTFYTPHTDASFEGASIAAKKEDADDYNEATALVFSTCPDAGTNTERLTISSTGEVKVIGSGSTGATLRLENTETLAAADDIAGTVNFYTNDASAPAGGRVCGYIRSVADDQYNRYGLRFGTANYNETVQERMRIDSSGVVQIRKQFTDTTTVERVLILDTHDESTVLPLNAGDGVGMLFKIPEATGSAIGASIDAEKEDSSDGNTSTRLVFRTSGNDENLDTALTISSTGLATFNNGISFTQTNTSATGAATDTNGTILDHYEEGTWTPVVAGGTCTATTGIYTRVGRQVTIILSILNGTLSGASGYTVTGLPFANSSTRSATSSVNHGDIFDKDDVVGLVDGSASTITFLHTVANASWEVANFQNGTGRYLHLTATYFV